MLVLAVQRLRRIGIAIPLAAVLMICGALFVGQAVWIHAKALLAQVLLERAFAATLASGSNVKPWSWADTWPVARVSVPRLRRSAIVLAGTSGQALAFGPGHVERTPAAGEPGTAIYSGHRDTHFAFLGDVAIGDEIKVTRRDGQDLRFRVTGTSVVRWDASGIDPLADGRHLALVTCWPLDGKFSGPLRYVVHAQMIDDEGAAAL
jgi:sortase A